MDYGCFWGTQKLPTILLHSLDHRSDIIFAAEFGLNERLSVLLKENVDVNVSDVKGFSPIMFAAGRGDLEMLSV